jgi:lantibiotic modifying enzyme
LLSAAPPDGNEVDRIQLLSEAAAIVDQIRDHGVRTHDGKMIWRGPTGYGTELTPLREVELGPYLGDGLVGIALFLAAFERLCNGGDCRDLALRALEPLRQVLAEQVADVEKAKRLETPVGGFIGVGSLIYGLAKVGEFLGETSLLHEAHSASALIDSERIHRDQQARIQTGCAGAILALLALREKFFVPNHEGITPLEIARACARHLLELRISFEGRPRAWSLSTGKPPLAGFSYGAAGVSYALLRLHEVVGGQELWDAAQEGLSFVRSLYCQEYGSWMDMRALFQSRYRPRRGTWADWWYSGNLNDLIEAQPSSPQREMFPETWAHGAVGIVLGRIGALHISSTPDILEEIERTLSRVQSYALGEDELKAPDELCYGHMGMIELLLSAYQRIGDVRSLQAAHALIARVWRRKNGKEQYDFLMTRGSEIFSPSLFQGIAGVGYTLLRLAEPESLPCLLLLE